MTKTLGNPNLNPAAVTTTVTVTTEVATGRKAVRAPVHLRVDILPQGKTTWVKITRLSTGKVIAQTRVPAGGHLGGGSLQDDYGFAVQSGIPGTSCWP